MRSRLLAVFALVLALAAPARAQDPTSPVPPAADPADVASIDAILTALYASISGAAGEERDWDRMRSLFARGAILAPSVTRPDGTTAFHAMDVEGWIAGATPFFAANPFYEDEIGREVRRFGNVANAMSAYASRRAPGEEPFTRGVNTITLVTDGARWYVVSIAWDEHRPGNEIPEAWLGAFDR